MSDLKLELVSREISSPVGDVVFVHGLGSNAQSAWTPEVSVGKGADKTEFESYFPSVLAADSPTINMGALDYNAIVSDWIERSRFQELPRHCNNILQYLRGKGIGDRPTIFVCHSLGGIVAKEVLRRSEQSKFKRLKQISKNTVALSFLATPHKGSKIADVVQAVNTVMPFLRPSQRIAELEHDNVYLEDLSHWYRQYCSNHDIETQAFFELKKTKGTIVVPRYSADPDVEGCQTLGINRNHAEICKPAKKTDEVYVSLCGLLSGHFFGGKPVPGVDPTQPPIPLQTVVIGVIVKSKKVLMVRRRNPTDNLTWQFVAGRQRVGQETEEECIIREAKEETGIDVQILERLGDSVDPMSPYRKIYYALRYLDGKESNSDPVENSEVRWVKIGNVDDFVTTKIDPRVRKFIGI
ncbi:alpha/beta fold hydrolase [Pseudophaeobacter leonis]|uniref:alpha/beta fold hydrolase n=1 Tax=Pseudophaeobacter leonis TaxID=1144477 RepID=UPI00111C3606|nr:alpha/beta fold hydrolase [Pseudophaeobacter leonis]